MKFNENAKLYLSGYCNRYGIDELRYDDIFEISECLLRLFTVLELVDSGYSK